MRAVGRGIPIRYMRNSVAGSLLRKSTEPVSKERLQEFGEVEHAEGLTASLRVVRHATKEVAARLLAELPVEDISIEEPQIEDVIRQVFAET